MRDPIFQVVQVLKDNSIQVYPLVMPRADVVLPCVVYQLITSKQFRHMRGNGLIRPTYQLSVWGKTYVESSELAETIKALFDLDQELYELSYFENDSDFPVDESELYRVVLELVILSK